MASRRQAREQALALLYEADIKDLDPRQLLEELELAPDPYAEQLVRGVAEHKGELDGLLGELAEDWEVPRMAVVDRNVLRMGLFELAHLPETPPEAILAEAVELASEYSTEASSRFVNGVLAAAAAKLGRGSPAR